MDKLDLKNPGVQKTALSVLLGGGLMAIFFFTNYLPFGYTTQKQQVTTLRADFERKSNELQRAKQTVADLPRFEAEYGRQHDRWVKAAELLPEDRHVSMLLRKITLAAQQTGVEFVVFRPTDVRNDQHYSELPLQLSVYGGYHQVGSFVAELANMRRIVTVSNLQIKTNVKSDNVNSTVSAEFTASAYSLNPGAVEAPAATQPKEGDARARKSS